MMQGAKACFINTDKNEYGTSLQRSSTRRPSNQTHERKINVFERDIREKHHLSYNSLYYIYNISKCNIYFLPYHQGKHVFM
jgi:hypothetical protein